MDGKWAQNGRNTVIFAVTSVLAYLLGLRKGYREAAARRRTLQRLQQALAQSEARNDQLMQLTQENARDDQAKR